MRVEIWSDIACPWCYIGKARFEKGLAAFAHRDEVEVVHRSFELDPNAGEPTGLPVIQLLADKYGLSPDEAEAAEARVAQTARGEGLGYASGRLMNGSTFGLHRLLHHAKKRGPEAHTALLEAFYRANFADLLPLGDTETVVAVAASAGLEEAEVRGVLADEEAYADDVRADEREASALGATGVPFFVLDRRFGVSGGQPAEVFTQALEQAHAAGGGLVQVQASESAPVCEDGACAVPAHQH
ncbi:DsbA family oxidoreductase [Streptomyces sp. NBC_01795]|uniref:DsbA family oxidoreductase n=1 Tax=unclassified Streptomyces TaxID=2593676 RepID=UPI002DDA1BC6|nr:MULTISPECIES: DsbA family oxidoreductase [unclassified Streptomyces]WSA95653.1 DsbA family oxidoreductase [Streptomyces sp. NBC_01795]WSB80071.1 DsbA family oxidoreductase [Streptomyces sp. NBC_01775]